MPDWTNIDKEADQAWWELAYKFFLKNDPKEKIFCHSELYRRNDNWDDFDFHRKTHVPAAGTFHGVSKRAILVVISRSRKLKNSGWRRLSEFVQPDQGLPDLDETDKSLINCVIALIYKEDGSPRPFIY